MRLYQFSFTAVVQCHKSRSLEQHKFTLSPFCKSEVWVAQLVSLFSLTKPKLNCQRARALIEKLQERIGLQVHANCWQNSVLYGCRTDVSLLAVSRRLVSASRSHPSSLDCGSLSSSVTSSAMSLLTLCFPLLLSRAHAIILCLPL